MRRAIEGWLTRDQALVLFEAAESLPGGTRSWRSAATRVAPRWCWRRGCHVVAASSRSTRSIRGGATAALDPRPLARAPRAAGVADRVEIVARRPPGPRARRTTARSTCCTSTASTTTGRCATTSAGRPASPTAVYCWCTTRSPRSVSPSRCCAGTLSAQRRLAYAGRTGSLARLDVRRPTAAER